MLKINSLAIKLFLALYLVSIYVEYIYMWVHMCIMSMNVQACAYVLSCFTCYLGLKMTAPLWLSPILMFNKVY